MCPQTRVFTSSYIHVDSAQSTIDESTKDSEIVRISVMCIIDPNYINHSIQGPLKHNKEMEKVING